MLKSPGGGDNIRPQPGKKVLCGDFRTSLFDHYTHTHIRAHTHTHTIVSLEHLDTHSPQDGGQSAAELERVILAMRKVIERLQSENSSLKSRVRSSQNKVSALSGLEEENKRLKVSHLEGG